MYLGDFAEDGDLFFKFTTRAFATGIPTTLSGSPVLSVYKDEGGAATEKTTAETYFDLDVDHDSIAGWNNVRIDLSGDAFFATGADYSVVITTGTVDSVNVFGENLANFSIENRSMGQPAGATLAADIIALKAETAAILIDTMTTLQGELDAIQAAVITNATGVDIAADIIAVKAETALIVADTNELQTDDVPTLISTLDAVVDTVKAETALIVADTNELQTDDVPTLISTLDAVVDTVKAETALIVADTNELQTDDVPTLIAALNDLAASDILTTALTEAYAADGVAPTFAQAIFMIMQNASEFAIASTTLTVKKLDGSATAATYTLDDATNPTSRTRAT